MIIGSGLLARAFSRFALDRKDLAIFAAGVSNSGCTDTREFEREKTLLLRSLEGSPDSLQFVYFSTCSVDDPESNNSPYVRHKLAMEELVRSTPGHVILRLPQVAGRTPNPHTLLNYLHARIARGERFTVWSRARRNIIDCDDVCMVAVVMLKSGLRGATVNVANTRDYAMSEIVSSLERISDGHAIYDIAERGASYPIDVSTMLPFARQAGIAFDAGYLDRALTKYYG